jgi:hypothetical protein
MLSSAAGTVEQYLAELAPERRRAVGALRQLILRQLPAGYEESMQYGMIGYRVPLARYPNTYNGQPLTVVALASQKRYMALYLMAVYGDPAQRQRLAESFRRAGKKLDMGKSCLRFESLEALPLDAIGALLAETSVDDFIAAYESTRSAKPTASGSPRASLKPAARRAVAAGPAKRVVAAKPAARRAVAAGPAKRVVAAKPAARRALGAAQKVKKGVSAKPAGRRVASAAGTAERALPAAAKAGARSAKARSRTKKRGAAVRAR